MSASTALKPFTMSTGRGDPACTGPPPTHPATVASTIPLTVLHLVATQCPTNRQKPHRAYQRMEDHPQRIQHPLRRPGRHQLLTIAPLNKESDRPIRDLGWTAGLRDSSREEEGSPCRTKDNRGLSTLVADVGASRFSALAPSRSRCIRTRYRTTDRFHTIQSHRSRECPPAQGTHIRDTRTPSEKQLKPGLVYPVVPVARQTVFGGIRLEV